jgi:hypothetical protein
LSHRLRLESLRETPLPSSPGSPTLNLTPVPSPKRDDLPRQEQEEEKAGESSDVEEEEKSKDWTDQEEEKSSDIKEEVKSKEAEAKKLAKEKVCETAGCKNPVPRGRGCPECKTRGIQGRFFCSQACFNSSWTLHKEVHRKARAEEAYIPFCCETEEEYKKMFTCRSQGPKTFGLLD